VQQHAEDDIPGTQRLPYLGSPTAGSPKGDRSSRKHVWRPVLAANTFRCAVRPDDSWRADRIGGRRIGSPPRFSSPAATSRTQGSSQGCVGRMLSSPLPSATSTARDAQAWFVCSTGRQDGLDRAFHRQDGLDRATHRQDGLERGVHRRKPETPGSDRDRIPTNPFTGFAPRNGPREGLQTMDSPQEGIGDKAMGVLTDRHTSRVPPVLILMKPVLDPHRNGFGDHRSHPAADSAEPDAEPLAGASPVKAAVFPTVMREPQRFDLTVDDSDEEPVSMANNWRRCRDPMDPSRRQLTSLGWKE